MTNELIVLLNEKRIGVVRQDGRRRLKFLYDDDWRETRGAYPLSLSMPLTASEHDHAVIDAYLWGLLPDNEFILGKWAQRFQVSARNAFALISNVGEDCAGAVQFVRPERLDDLLAAGPGQIDWIDEEDIANRLKSLRADHSAWRRPQDTGQFSLAGAQPKTALYYENGRWGVPSGRMPTTHILKPPTGEFDGHAENEHFCLALARRLGLPTAGSSIQRFDDEVAIVIERYDRRRTANGVIRAHQEDICQALGISPTKKYQNEGGPSIADIVTLLKEASTATRDDIDTLLRATALSWLIAGTDAHAKNYSVLIGAGGRARLAPLYDLASALPYDEFDSQKLKLAMKIGGEYRLRDIGKRQWMKMAEALKTNGEAMLALVSEIALAMPEATNQVHRTIQDQGVTHPVIDKAAKRIAARAQACLMAL